MEALMREKEKIQVLQHFISGTNQELRYPLKGVLDLTEKLIDKYSHRHFEYIGFKEFNDILETLKSMRDQIQYCFDTTNRLFILDKRKNGLAKSHAHVNKVLKEVTQHFKHELFKMDLSIKWKLAPNPPDAAIDPIELTQVIDIVLTNAIQSFSGGGKITLSTKYYRVDNCIRIDCRDQGIGMTKETLRHVFDPFFTTKQRGLNKSSGLGLSIVYSIIKARHGDIKIKSNLREGTTVQISLPVHKS